LGTFIDDVSVTCTSDNGRVFNGGKFEDTNADGLWGDGEVGIPNWNIYVAEAVGSFTLNTANGAVTSPVLETGVNYIMKVTGTFTADSEITADAMYAVKSPNVTWTDTVPTYTGNGSTFLDLQIDGVSPFWGEYNAGHTYFTRVTGTGVPLNFSVNDALSLSKVGELTISIFEVVNTAVTDNTGHYVLEYLGWDGEASAVIMEDAWQPGWTQTFPGVDRGGVHLVTWDEAWSQDWAYNFGNKRVVREEVPPEEPPEEPPQVKTGTLSLAVNVINDNGGTKTVADFTVDVTDINTMQIVPATTTITNVQVEGAYTAVLAGNTEGYAMAYSTECNDTMVAGGSKACVITLDDMDVFSVTAPVAPTVLCVDNAGDGKLTAHFGYLNLNAGPVFIPAGTFDNRIVGGGLTDTNQGQPSFFEPGIIDDAFQVVFNSGAPLVWVINTPVGEFSIEANNLTEQCNNTVLE
jgi:hypothetical protein